jgi:manganese/zinc/iron transport system substrate-binding protein
MIFKKLLAIIGLMPVLAGCLPGPTPSTSRDRTATGQERYTIVVTTSMVGDLVRHVAGERAEVRGLMGTGVDPHLFRPTSDDIGRVMQADVVFYSGLLLEGGLQSALERAARSGKPVHAVTESLPRERLRHPPEFEGHPDPHVWHDAALWSRCLETVVDVLSRFDPDHSEEYRENAERYREELLQVDRLARDAVRTIPEERRYLVTSHDAFGYFCRTYGLEERSVQGLTTASEPAVQDINQLVDFLVEHRVPAIFQEETVNVAHVRAVIEGARRRGWTVRIHGPLYSDSMGPAGSETGTYVGMMRHNVRTIVEGLGGSMPEGG